MAIRILSSENISGEVLIASGKYLSWGTAGATSIEGSTVSNKLQFRTNSVNRMQIDSGGSIAVGNFNPSGTPTGDYRSLEIGKQGNTITGAPWKSNLYFSTNATITAGSTTFTYRALNELPTQMVMEDGIISFSNAVAPTAIGDTIAFTERMSIEVDGNVSFNSGLLELGNASSTPNIGYGMFHYSGVGLGIYSSAGGGTQGIGFWLNNGTAAYEAGRWLSDGNFGIGTISPANKLDVQISTSNRTTLEPVLSVSANGNGPYTGFGPKISFSSNIYYGAATGNPAGIIETAYIGAVMGVTYATNSDLVFATRDGATSVTEKMRILGDGNVGIGTTGPRAVGSGYKGLEVSSPSSGSSLWLSGFSDTTKGYLAMDTGGLNLTAISNHSLTFGTNNSPKMTILSGGNVGIGTSSPGTALAFGGFGSIWVNNDTTNPFGMDTVGGELRLFVGTGSASYQMKFGKYSGTTFTPHMTIGDDGSNPSYVGIGTTNPSSKLTVYGGGTTSSTLELRGAANGGDNATISTQQSMAFQIGSAGATGRSFTFLKNGLGYSDGTALFSIDANGGTFNRLWPQTGTSGSSSVVQTTLIPEPGIYEYYLQGNPNAQGSGAYRSLQAGLITIAVDYTVANSVFLRIKKTVTAQDGGGSGNIQLNLNVYMLYNGSASDEQSIANKDQSVIYLTVSGYSTTVGSGQILRLTRKV